MIKTSLIHTCRDWLGFPIQSQAERLRPVMTAPRSGPGSRAVEFGLAFGLFGFAGGALSSRHRR